ncbi:DUF1499 domain-containing protein [Defluviimonas sp. WL0002]|uniref:DUF1499 domain-containing protein n=1 Tax=Albidovulum marisflavi TaxID=2984159 RepID=A0ABT2ZHB9_9RHOB|nr:DUF1499 domain-containing protein [Defluviimonas sp. WL0002]MCV2870501.1 DUF1499 domain-containing protein [Defluviimonas sp. WL0002]
MRVLLYLAVLAVIGGMAYIRLAPADPSRWHVSPLVGGQQTVDVRGLDSVHAVPGGARVEILLEDAAPESVLAQLDAIAVSTPRTRRLAGSPSEGMITWVTRTAAFGFPDYTTAAARPEGEATRLGIFARQRFGSRDLGVNAARLEDWISRLEP